MKRTPYNVTEDASLLVETLLEAEPESFDPDAEITRLATYTCPECSSTNTSQPDDEGLVDCMECGIWFNPTHARNRHALHGQAEGSLCQNCGKAVTPDTRSLVTNPQNERESIYLCGPCTAHTHNDPKFWVYYGYQASSIGENAAPEGPPPEDPKTPEDFQTYIDKYAAGPPRKTIKHIETTSDYREYQIRVRDFFHDEGINNLSAAENDEGGFSWSRCECCSRNLGGTRYSCSGYSPATNEVKGPYSICSDCYYYAEYGKLDDQTMLDLKDDLKPEPPTE